VYPARGAKQFLCTASGTLSTKAPGVDEPGHS
jgi:hypothetical protein